VLALADRARLPLDRAEAMDYEEAVMLGLRYANLHKQQTPS
jgi:hypothetical protein